MSCALSFSQKTPYIFHSSFSTQNPPRNPNFGRLGLGDVFSGLGQVGSKPLYQISLEVQSRNSIWPNSQHKITLSNPTLAFWCSCFCFMISLLSSKRKSPMTRNTAKIIGQVTAIVSLYFLARPQLPPHSAHLVFKNACGKKKWWS